MTLRSALYAAARLLGDLNAIKRGPKATVTRIGKKAVLRRVAGPIGRWKP